MERVTVFDKKNIGRIQKEMELAVQGVAEKYGVSIKGNGGQMDFHKATLKFKLYASADESGVSAEQHDFEMWAQFYPDIESEWYGKIFAVNNVEYKVVGINSKARKDFINLVRVSDGNAMKCPPDYVKYNLHAESVEKVV